MTPGAEYPITVGAGGAPGVAGGDSGFGLVLARGGQPGTATPGTGGTADCGGSPGLTAPGGGAVGDRPGTAGVIPSAPPSGIGAGGAPGAPGAAGYVLVWW